MKSSVFDVVICGGGLAGLTLAIQLKNARQGISVCILERQPSPLPESAHKVGESTVVIGAYYLEKVLGLKHYLEEAQLEKLGLRFFFSDGQYQPFHTRPELGRSRYKAVASEWQLDRGRLENDLRSKVMAMGVELIEAASVKDVAFWDAGEENTVHYEQQGKPHSIRCRWVVDAMGRRRHLQRMLSIQKDSALNSHSSSWFRIKGRLDFAAYVPGSERAWHARVAGGHPKSAAYGRNNSTTHFVGNGYWVWVIPLSAGNTSIGVVAEESAHPFSSYNSLLLLNEWLKQHESDLYDMVREYEILDFGCRRNFSYSCQQFVSTDGWALSGEAGVFIDPLYSPGTDAIGYSNSVITAMVCRDLAGLPYPRPVVDFLNKDFIAWSDRTLANVYDTYSLLGGAEAASLKVVWDLTSSVWLNGIKFRNAIFSENAVDRLLEYGTAVANCAPELQRLERLKSRMIALLNEWRGRGESRAKLVWLDYFDDLEYLYADLATVVEGSSDMRQDLLFGVRRLEDLALAIFVLLLKDVDPERATVVQQLILEQGIHIQQISLSPVNSRAEPAGDDGCLDSRNISYIVDPLSRAFFVGMDAGTDGAKRHSRK